MRAKMKNGSTVEVTCKLPKYLQLCTQLQSVTCITYKRGIQNLYLNQNSSGGCDLNSVQIIQNIYYFTMLLQCRFEYPKEYRYSLHVSKQVGINTAMQMDRYAYLPSVSHTSHISPTIRTTPPSPRNTTPHYTTLHKNTTGSLSTALGHLVSCRYAKEQLPKVRTCLLTYFTP